MVAGYGQRRRIEEVAGSREGMWVGRIGRRRLVVVTSLKFSLFLSFFFLLSSLLIYLTSLMSMLPSFEM